MKIGVDLNEKFSPIEHMLHGGALSEDLGLAEIEVEISILFENGLQFCDELKHFGEWTDDTTVVSVCEASKFWEILENTAPEMKGDQAEYHELWTLNRWTRSSTCSAFHMIRSTVIRVKAEDCLT